MNADTAPATPSLNRGVSAPSPSPPPPCGQLGVIREMLSVLDTLTAAGQQHVMSKVVCFMRGQVGRASPKWNAGHHRSAAEILGHLEHETSRMMPDVPAFTTRAEFLMALLAAIG